MLGHCPSWDRQRRERPPRVVAGPVPRGPWKRLSTACLVHAPAA